MAGVFVKNLAPAQSRFIGWEPAAGLLLRAPLRPPKQSSGWQSPLVFHLVNQGNQLRNPAQASITHPEVKMQLFSRKNTTKVPGNLLVFCVGLMKGGEYPAAAAEKYPCQERRS